MTAADRDPDALLAHTTWVRKLALQLCADVHAAEDAAQETWAAALQKPPRDPERARGFLARTLRNVLAMAGRSERRRARRERLAALPADASDVDASELVARAELHRQLVGAVLRLPEVPRELVLRHYFEGVDVATLAHRTGISPDAVRAQLRRAREKLRADLERDGGEAARAFGLLIAASRPEVLGIASAASVGVAATAGALTIMKTKILLGTAAAIAVLWFVWPTPDRPTTDVLATKPDDAAAVALGAAPEDTTPDATPVTRTEALPTAEAAPVELHGKLDGVHPDVLWTTPLIVRATGSTHASRVEHNSEAAVAADGTFRVTLPAWFRTGDSVELRLAGRDPFYLSVDARRRPSLTDREQPITVPVEPVSVVTGKVVDPRGAGVPDAQVGVFVTRDPSPSDPGQGETLLRCSTNTEPDGSYRLQVPAAAPMLILAVPRKVDLLGDGGHRDDLLPAYVRIATRWGKLTQAPELRLVEPAWVTGSITTGDDAPLVGVDVIWIHNSSDGPALYDHKLGNLMTWTDGSAGRIARTETDRNGRFRLPATPGKTGVCFPRDAQGRAEPMVEMVTATAPAEVALRLDGGIAVVRVLCGGLPVPGVVVTTDSIRDRLTQSENRRRTDSRGEARLLRSKSAAGKVSVHRPGSASVQVDVPARASANEPLVVELPPLPMARVQIEFEDAIGLSLVAFTWARTDTEIVPLLSKSSRTDTREPFRCYVPPGRYQLHVSSPGGTDWRDRFLIASRHDVEVPLQGRSVKLPAAYGGRIHITMTDRDGRYALGNAEITGSAGRFTWTLGREPQDSSAMPAGSYELRIESRGRVLHQAAVDVETCKVTDVRVRLP